MQEQKKYPLPFELLDAELTLRIISFVSLSDIISLKLVCMSLNSLLNSPNAFKPFDRKDDPQSEILNFKLNYMELIAKQNKEIKVLERKHKRELLQLASMHKKLYEELKQEISKDYREFKNKLETHQKRLITALEELNKLPKQKKQIHHDMDRFLTQLNNYPQKTPRLKVLWNLARWWVILLACTALLPELIVVLAVYLSKAVAKAGVIANAAAGNPCLLGSTFEGAYPGSSPCWPVMNKTKCDDFQANKCEKLWEEFTQLKKPEVAFAFSLAVTCILLLVAVFMLIANMFCIFTAPESHYSRIRNTSPDDLQFKFLDLTHKYDLNSWITSYPNVFLMLGIVNSAAIQSKTVREIKIIISRAQRLIPYSETYLIQQINQMLKEINILLSKSIEAVKHNQLSVNSRIYSKYEFFAKAENLATLADTQLREARRSEAAKTEAPNEHSYLLASQV